MTFTSKSISLGRALKSLSASLFLAASISMKAMADDAKYTGKTFWGITTKAVAASTVSGLESFPADMRVLKVMVRCPGATGEAEDIQPGDVIVQVDGKAAADFITAAVSGSRGGAMKVGEHLKAKVLKVRKEGTELVEKEIVVQRYPGTREVPYKECPAAAEFKDFVPVQQHLAEQELAKIKPQVDDLLERLRRVDQFQDSYRLPICSFLFRNPFTIEAVCRGFKDRTSRANTPETIAALGWYAMEFSDSLPENPKDAPASPQEGVGLDDYLDYMVSVIQLAAAHHDRAFKALSDEERKFVQEHRKEVFDAVLEFKMPSYDPNVEHTKRLLKICSILFKIDRSELLNQFNCASLLTSKPFLDSLCKAAEPLADKGIVASRETPFGAIVVAGKGRNRHNSDAAVLIDLGGDDEYFNNQGTSMPGTIPTSVLVDIAGNDAYESTDNISQGCGNLGVGILLDCEGDDSYLGMQFVQGIGYGGIGMLIDKAGNDVYRALTFSQGCAFFGYGVLSDLAGDDRYDAKQTSQGVGLPRGFGLLRDTGGKNLLFCKGDMITSYGTRGRFSGWCQGFGFGLRPYASGGIGMLYTDSSGNRMVGGDFCQGGGYYCSLGMLISAGKSDDSYIGTRYAQGFGVHQAAGAFLECGGDDTYRTRHCVAQGLAWDEAICSFVDEAGNDNYDGSEGFSLGSSAHNAICLFHDATGNDVYATDVAVRSNNSYHGGTSLTIFLDSDGEDSYTNKKNNTLEAYPENVVFIDK